MVHQTANPTDPRPPDTDPMRHAGSEGDIAEDDGRPRIAYVQALVHGDIVDQARIGFDEVIGSQAVVDHFTVPGAFELPLAVQNLAATARYGAIVAAGFVVDGGIYRHEFVADAVIAGLMRVQLDQGVPVLSLVLTPQHFHEHDDHHRFFAAHMATKGDEVGRACLDLFPTGARPLPV